MDLLFIPTPCYVREEKTGQSHRISEDVRQKIFANYTRSCIDIQNSLKIQADVFNNSENTGSSDKIVLSFFGAYRQLIEAKALFQRSNKQIICALIQCDAPALFNENCKLKEDMEVKIQKITKTTETEVVARLDSPAWVSDPVVQLDAGKGACIEIIGDLESVAYARVLLLAELFQESGKECSLISDVPAKFMPLIAGRRANLFHTIMDGTTATIAYPLGMFNADECIPICISGSPENIADVKVMIGKAHAEAKSKSIKKSIFLATFKAAYMQNDKRSDLARIMAENGVFMDFSSDSNDMTEIVVSGLHANSVEAAFKSLVDLSTTIFQLNIILSSNLIPELSRLNIARGQFTKRFSNIALFSNAEISITASVISVFGDSSAIAKAGLAISEIDEIRQIISEIRIYTDLSASYKEFITGKKNGKITKITKSCSVAINFVEPSKHLLIIEIAGHTIQTALDAFQQLKDELPAEFEFFVSDSHHKRIIGVGGKNIQSIMKIYGVYVKFVNSDEFRSMGGINRFDKNAIARTPAKNSSNLVSLYNSVMEHVDVDFKSHQQQQLLVNRKHMSIVRQMWIKEKSLMKGDNILTNVVFPEPWDSEQLIAITGVADDIQRIADNVRESIPALYRMKISLSNDEKSLEEAVAEARKFALSFGFKISLSKNGGVGFLLLQTTMAKKSSLNNVTKALSDELKRRGIEVLCGTDNEFVLEALVGGKLLTSVFTANGKRSQNMKFKDSLLVDSRGMVGSAPNLPALDVDAKKTQNVIGAEAKPGLNESNATVGVMHSAIDQILVTSGSMNSFFPRLNTGAEKPDSSAIFGSAETTEKKAPGLRITTSQEFIQSEVKADQSTVTSVVQNALPRDADNKLDVLLESIDLGKFKKTLADNDVDFEMFLKLTEEDFKELGLTIGARKRIMESIAEIKKGRGAEISSQMKSAAPASPITYGGAKTSMATPLSPGSWAAGDWAVKTGFTPFSYRSAGIIQESSRLVSNMPMTTISSPLSPARTGGFPDFKRSTPLASPIGQNGPNVFKYPSSPSRTKLLGVGDDMADSWANVGQNDSQVLTEDKKKQAGAGAGSLFSLKP
eukprot:Partr_v1_DN27637_c1_g1_i1_m64743 putative High density lipoprotein binding protein